MNDADPHADCPAPVFKGSRWVCPGHYPPQRLNITRDAAPKGFHSQLAQHTQQRRGVSGTGATLGQTVTTLQAGVAELEAEAIELRAAAVELRGKLAPMGKPPAKASKRRSR